MENNNRKTITPLSEEDMEELFYVSGKWDEFFVNLVNGAGCFRSERTREAGVRMMAKFCLDTKNTLMRAVLDAKDRRTKARRAEGVRRYAAEMRRLNIESLRAIGAEVNVEAGTYRFPDENDRKKAESEKNRKEAEK